MNNPFIKVQAGVFATVPSSGGKPNLAEKICAALALRIAELGAGQDRLDPPLWTMVFNKVPFVSPATEVSGSISGLDPAACAAICLGEGVVSDAAGAPEALAAWIAALDPLPAKLNCLAVTSDNAGLIHMSLAFADPVGGTFRRTDTVLNAHGSQQELDAIFGLATPLDRQPYFCSLQT
jgi:hypothetical protein